MDEDAAATAGAALCTALVAALFFVPAAYHALHRPRQLAVVICSYVLLLILVYCARVLSVLNLRLELTDAEARRRKRRPMAVVVFLLWAALLCVLAYGVSLEVTPLLAGLCWGTTASLLILGVGVIVAYW